MRCRLLEGMGFGLACLAFSACSGNEVRTPPLEPPIPAERQYHEDKTGMEQSKIQEDKIIQEKNLPGEAIVVFRPGITIEEAQKIVASHGFTALHHYKTLSQKRGQIYLLIGSALGLEETIKILSQESAVESVSPNYPRKLD